MATFDNRLGRLAGGMSLLAMLCAGCSSPVHSGAGPARMVEIGTRNEDGIIHLSAQNLTVADVTVTIDLQLWNLKGSTNFPCTATIPGGETVELFTLDRISKNAQSDFKYTYSATIGSINAIHDDSYSYLLPFAPGAAFRVSQGNHGAFSHTGPDEYAFDWDMPLGTPVLAAREGLVVKSKDDSNQGGPDRKYQAAANCILIRHSDGTIGMYGHLKQGGNKVKVGDRVRAGEELGLSGNTGFTEGPHLHFSVFKVQNGRERVSLPVKFQVGDRTGLVLEAGQVYQAGPAATPQFTTLGLPAEAPR